MQNMKTAVQRILDAAERGNATSFMEWLEDNAESLISDEKAQIVEAWKDGNREGWEMNTDWPEHGVRYYKQKYASQNANT